jgi:hypothetical protein
MTAQGYVLPISTLPLPRQLNLVQFIQTVIAGVSGIEGPLVRPKWQPNPPKNPDIDIDWIAFGVTSGTPDANGFVGVNRDGATVTQRHEGLEIGCSLYGPNALETAGLIRDGFQIPQNLEGLRSANMGFVDVSRALHVPELVNERWINRLEMTINLRREIQRVYPILTLLSATGSVHTVVGDEQYLLDWATQT